MAGKMVQVAAHSILGLDGRTAGPLPSVSVPSVSVQGNVATFEPSRQATGPMRVGGQGNVFSFEFGSGMSPAFFDWIDAFVQRRANPRQIALYSTDLGYRVQSAREYNNAQITELVFPVLDAASMDPVRMALTLRANNSSDRPPSGKMMHLADSGGGGVTLQ